MYDIYIYISADPSHLQGERAREKVASRHLFFWFQKATLGSRLPLNASRRPRPPLNLALKPCPLTLPGVFGGPAACPLATCRALFWRFSSRFRKQR